MYNGGMLKKDGSILQTIRRGKYWIHVLYHLFFSRTRNPRLYYLLGKEEEI